MSKYTRKAVLLLSGQAGTTAASLAALWCTFRVFSETDPWIYESMAAIVLARMGYFLTRGPRPVLETWIVRKRVWRLMVDEGKISTGFLAISFILSWPLTHLEAAIFIAANLIGQLGLMLFSKVALRSLMRHMRSADSASFEKRVLIVGTGKRATEVADMIIESPELETRLIGFLDYHRTGLWRYRDFPLLGRPDLLKGFASCDQIDAVFIAVDPEDLPRTRELFETAEHMGVAVCLMPNIYEPRVARVRPSYINGLPAMVYRAVPENQITLLAKSAIDKLGALVGLLLASPIMLLTALVIKLDSRGPVFYRQTRAGLNGKPFKLYKFRTMQNGAARQKKQLQALNEMSGPVFKIKNDPRVTRVGRFLRKFSIDELPQFINVLKGEMSLVGPRPPLPREVIGFQPWQRRKLSVKPGVTCIWQVNGRNHVDFDDWMRLDLQYIDNWSLWLDAKILAQTIPTVVKGTGS